MKKRKNKRGTSVVTIPLILVFCMLCIVMIGVFTIHIITPFIWYEKLNTVANNYMFIVEKYGYLTEEEEEKLRLELENSGFDTKKLTIEVPKEKKEYGEPVHFSLCYSLSQTLPVLGKGGVGKKEQHIPIEVHKYSFCKR